MSQYPPSASTVEPLDLAHLEPVVAWGRLAGDLVNAVGSARHPFHLVHVGTVDSSGLPQVRTVVLRRFDDAPGSGIGPALPPTTDDQSRRAAAWFHTDIRSPKVSDLRRTPAVALHWYDPSRRLQIRVSATAVIHHLDAVARNAWSRSKSMSRACYLSRSSPGLPLTEYPPAPPVPHDDDGDAFVHFSAIGCQFDRVEVLELAAEGHRRFLLRLDARGVTRQILAP
ncbi:MAG: pyridoxamine 5'-phosphate oxidase family protein [Planctomycetaceae bacterium]